MRVLAEPLRRVVSSVFAAAGCTEAEARRVADHLVDANLMGHDSHGVIRTQRYVNAVRDNAVVVGQSVETVIDGGAFAIVDGNHGFGQTVGPQACELGIDKARQHGVAVVGLRRSGHLGRIGHFAEMAAEAGQVSIHFVNVASSTLVAPFGAIDRRMGTNPISIGMPVADRPAIILDFATSVAAEGKALVALKGGKGVPADALISADGTITDDPTVLYGPPVAGKAPNPRDGSGALRAMGHHKGSGLALMCELIAGALIGSGTAGPPPQQHGNGMLSVYLDLEQFAPGDQVMADVITYIDWFIKARPADGDRPVMLPGDPERARRRERDVSGIELSEAAWDSIMMAAESVGVDRSTLESLI